MRNLRIVFMGTPEFAVPSLKILVENEFNIVGAITAPDKPKGRGRQLSVSAVKAYCQTQEIRLLQPTNLKSESFLNELQSLDANLFVVVAFRMLPEVVWTLPKYGTFNLHGSLLPNYRGAAPINWAIINGESETGVTTFFIEKEIDTGNIIFQDKEIISKDDDAGTLYNRLMERGAQLVLKTVKAVADGNVEAKPQKLPDHVSAAPKIHRETCEISWNQPAENVYNFIRGMSPYPAAWTTIGDSTCKILKSTIEKNKGETKLPGQYWVEENKDLYFKTIDGVIKILELQMQGKKKMETSAFLRGNTL